MDDLKQFCKEEWSKITPGHCAGLIHSYRKRLLEVIAAKMFQQILSPREPEVAEDFYFSVRYEIPFSALMTSVLKSWVEYILNPLPSNS